MAESVGEIGLDLVVNRSGFDKDVKGIQNLAKKAGTAIAAVFGTKKLLEFGSSCLELGSDLAEVQNVVDVTFPHMSDKINDFAQSAAANFGLSETMAKNFAGTFGSMAEAFGFTEKQAADMGMALTGLAGDVASFYNISQDEAYTKLKSVFTGETESLKDLGVVMTQSALDSYALANGFGKTTSKMTEAEKVALRYAFVQEQLANAQGDFSRTSESWANQVKVLSLQFDSLKASIGQGLINVLSPVLTWINKVVAKVATMASAFKAFTELITGKKSSSGKNNGVTQTAESADTSSKSLNKAAGSAKKLNDSVKKTGKEAKKAAKEILGIAGFDELQNYSSSSSDSDTSDSGSTSDDSDSTSGTTGSSISVPTVDFGSLAKSDETDDTSDSLQKLKEILEKLQTACQPTIDALKRLKKALKPLKDFACQALLDFYNDFLVPVGKWVVGKGLPKLIDSISNGLSQINFTKINKALDGVWKALAPFAEHVGDGLLWFFDKVLVPIGTWTVNNVVTNFLKILSSVIKILDGVLEALKPLGKWLYDKFLVPIGKWTGGVVAKVLEGISGAFEGIADFVTKHQKAVQIFVTTLGGLAGLSKAIGFAEFVTNAGGAIGVLKKLKDGFVAATTAKIKDKIQTAKICALYAKDFAVSVANGTKLLLANVKAFAKNTALKIKDKVATVAHTIAEKASAAASKLMAAAQKVLNAVLNANPIAKVVVAVTAVIAIVVLLYNKCEWFRNGVDAIVSAVTGFFKSAAETIPQVFGACIEGIKETAGKIKDAFVSIPGWFKEKFEAAYKAVTGAFDGAKKFFEDIWTKITTALSDVKTWFEEKFVAAYNAIKTAFDGIKEFFTGVWTKITTALSNVKTWFKEKFVAAYNAIKTAFSGIKEFFTGVWTKITTALSSVKTWFKEKFAAAYNAIKTAFDGIKEFFTGVWTKITTALSDVKTWFKEKFGDAYDMATGAFDKVGQTFEDVWTAIKKPFKEVVTWFEGKFSDAWTAVKNVFSKKGKIFDGIKEGIASTFKTIVNGLISGINKVISIPFKAINAMLNKIRNVGIGKLKPFAKLWSENPLSIPEIPKLAKGGYVEANTPQLAMIGDNRHQGEVVAPEDKLSELLDTALSKAGSVTANAIVPVIERLCNAIIDLENNGSGSGVVLEGVSDSGLYRIVKKEQVKENKRTGKKE